MKRRVELKLSMELLSDAIFGSGFSIPGGEDISVYTDVKGYPFFKAASLKGLLRDSLSNLLSWKGLPSSNLGRLLGTDDREGTDDGSRLFLTDLILKNKPNDPEKCFARRSFTSLEHGVAKEKTLREAVCICTGQVFEGTVSCAESDVELVVEALSLIKFVGSSRNRGFGQVAITCWPVSAAARSLAINSTGCLRYVLHTELPLIITKLSSSVGNGYGTRNYIPGSAIRGFVVGKLAQENPDWFLENKEALLSESTRFLNAFPTPSDKPAIPSLMGFYEDKADPENRVESVVKGKKEGEKEIPFGWKRAKIGSFCALEEGSNVLTCWSTDTGGYTRIDRRKKDKKNKTKMFQTEHINANQDFTGYIFLDDPSLTEAVASAFSSEIWLGADRYEGFGKCSLKSLEAMEEPAYFCYGEKNPGPELYMTLLSPTCMLDENDEPCGLDFQQLAACLGVGSITREELRCSTSVSEYGGYNRTWACREPAVRMYDSGSVFKLVCEKAPTMDALKNVQRSGLGIRRAEGFGQVLFLKKGLYEGISRKETIPSNKESSDAEVASNAAVLRRAKIKWVMNNASMLQQDENDTQDKPSRSQIGTLQAFCEKAIAQKDASAKDMLKYLNDNLMEYKEIGKLITCVIGENTDLRKTLDLKDSMEIANEDMEKLCLLVMLFNYSRKEGG